MKMKITDQLLRVAEAYCKASALSMSRVSTLVFNDGKTFDLIRRGKAIYTSRFDLAMDWFSTNWPENADWPEGVLRPTPSSEPAKASQ